MPETHPATRRGALLILSFVLYGALSLGALASEAAPAAQPADAPEPAAQNPSGSAVEGRASYYSSRYSGRKMTSGKKYDPKKLTAAHPSLPLGQKVRVKNLANGKSVVVTVTDRCRKKRVPFIDLSREAACRLGFFGKGLARVEIEPLDVDAAADTPESTSDDSRAAGSNG